MSKPNTITIDEVLYVRADSLAKPTGNRVIAVLDKGWIMVGFLGEASDTCDHTLTDCYNLRKWGSGGFGGVTLDPEGSAVVLDKCADVAFNSESVIQFVSIPDDWNS